MEEKNKVERFYDLKAWKESHRLTLEIYRITKSFPKDEIFGIISQLRRAASSIAANLAEGFARFHFKDKTRFYYQARGSVAEVQNFLILSKDLTYIDLKTCKSLGEIANEVGKLINGMIRFIERNKK